MKKEEIEEIIRNLGDIGKSIEDKNILVTGGAGFLGSWICEVLVEQQAKVICLDNLVSRLKSNISHLIDKDNFKFIQHDVTQPIFFDERIDVVMHLASRASPFELKKYPIQILKANTLGIWVALGIAKKHDARFLYTSTSEVYGKAVEIPTSEEYNGNVNPIGPRSCYDEAKRCGESYVIAYKMQHDLDIRIARIFNTYGPRMRAEGAYGRVVPRFIEQALNNEPLTVFGDGTQTRSFCYVTDQIEGLLKLAFSEEAKGEVVNIGNDKELTILELAKLIRELTNSSAEIVFEELPKDDPPGRKPDITKAKKILGWEPKVGLEEGLLKMIKWKALVTGCSGFIGSHLVDRLLESGYGVIGIDCFTDYYPREIKEANIPTALQNKNFKLIEEDILEMDKFPEVDYIFHLAAQAGVRASWGKSFEIYTRNNVQATQKLLEFYKDSNIKKFVYASSSSVYGDAELPMKEDSLLKLVSPYGVTKLAGENLCYLYWKNYNVPTVSLRYFTVYGPRQRPDMAIHKFVRAILNDEEITTYGDGTQTRDFTFVDDAC